MPFRETGRVRKKCEVGGTERRETVPVVLLPFVVFQASTKENGFGGVRSARQRSFALSQTEIVSQIFAVLWLEFLGEVICAKSVPPP